MVVVTVQKVTLAEKKGLGRKNRSVFSHWGLRTKGGGDEIYCTDSPISLPIRAKKAFLFLLHEDPFWINQRREGEIMFILSPPAKTSPPTPPETMVQNQRRGSAIVAAENCTSFDFCTSSSSSSILRSGNEEEQNHRRSVDRPHCSVCIAKANIAFRRLRFLPPPSLRPSSQSFSCLLITLCCHFSPPS